MAKMSDAPLGSLNSRDRRILLPVDTYPSIPGIASPLFERARPFDHELDCVWNVPLLGIEHWRAGPVEIGLGHLHDGAAPLDAQLFSDPGSGRNSSEMGQTPHHGDTQLHGQK